MEILILVAIIIIAFYFFIKNRKNKSKSILENKGFDEALEANFSTKVVTLVKESIKKSEKRKEDNLDKLKYNSEIIETKTHFLLLFFNQLESAYSLSDVKKCIDIVSENFIFLLDVSETSTYRIDIEEGIKTYLITQKTELNKKVVDCIDKPNNNDFHDLINFELLNIVKRVETKNNELIENYKNEDKIKERYRVVYDNSIQILELIKHSNNQFDIIQEINRIKDRAYKRGQLHNKIN